jgi:hypothetical protein
MIICYKFMRRAIDISHFIRAARIFGFVLIFFSTFALAGVAFAETRAVDPITILCPKTKLLVDRVAIVILNQPPQDVFEVAVKQVLAEICAFRKESEANPEIKAVVDNVVVAVLGWAWNVSSFIKFKGERNTAAADIAAKEIKRQVTAMQTICPTLVIPDVASIP